MNRHIGKLVGTTLVLMGLVGVSKSWATNPTDATITVTPTATVSLAVSPTTYAFGPLAVNTSSTSASAITLTNDGQVGETVAKKILTQSTPAGWTAAASASVDQYVLYVATATARPGSFASATKYGAQGNSTALTDDNGTDIGTMNTSGATSTASLWFKLDMPSSVTATTARTITVEFTGTGQ